MQKASLLEREKMVIAKNNTVLVYSVVIVVDNIGWIFAGCLKE